jgi:aminopeptidase YwaD
MPKPVTIRSPSEHVGDILARTHAFVEKCHPRLPGTPGCLRAARELRDELARSCDRADLEEYSQHPGSFFAMNKVLAVGYLAAAAFYYIGGWGIPVSATLFILGVAYFANMFAFLGRFFDPLFRKMPGANVVGTMEPRSDVRQAIVFCAHHDSSPVCNFFENFPGAYAFRTFLPVAFYVVAAVGVIVASASLLFGTGAWGGLPALRIVIAAGLVFVVPVFWYFGREASPGASDNLASSFVLVKLAELVKSGAVAKPEHTRLMFVSVDGEENGQRGSSDFARKHKAELLGLRTFVFNMDTLARLKDLAFLETDTNGLRKLSAPLTAECLEIAADLGYPVKAVRFPFGGGGTDAGQFAKIGVDAVSLIGVSTHPIRKDIDYHTSRDTVDNIEPAAVEAGLMIAIHFALAKDMQAR